MLSLNTRVKSYLRKAITPRYNVPCMSTLAKLPPELLLTITNSLSPVDLICFSLCSHRLFDISLGKGVKRLPSCTKDEKLFLLTRLDRDLPTYFACDACNLLHRYDGSESLRLGGSPGKLAVGRVF
jgi:hypothetical protein